MSVASSTAAITFTPEASEGPITVNGATVTSGSPSQSIALAPGVNAINIVVTAADGVTTNTYAIAITRLLPQTITFAFSGNQPTGLPDSSPASSSSGLPITYASSNTSRAPIVNGKIHLQTIGSVVITASQPGNSVYEAATPVSQTIAVTKGTAVITLATRDTVVYGAANYTPAVSTNTGTNITLSSNNTAVITTASSNTRLKINGIGTAVITASQAGTTNYNAPASKTQTIVVVKAPATAPIIFPALAAVRYNEQDFSPGATSTIPVVITYISSDTTVAKIVNGNIHVVSPGTTTITASQAAADAFHLPPTPVSQSLTVKPIPVLLSSLSLSAGQLTKLDNNTYTALITGLATDRLKLTPTATDAGSTITVNGVAVQSGEPSQFITLNAAGTPTLITIVVQDTALNSQPITLTVNRQAFTNADLASLQVSAGVLTKTGETTYQTIIRDNTVTRLSLNAITADATATLAINGVPTASGTNSALINLNSTGQTAINIQATAESGATKTYTLNVIKLSANADLASLSFNRGKLTRTSDTGYNLVVVGSVISQVYQSATTANSKATLTVNGSAVTSGSNVAVPLNATGPTTVAIVVTAENDATKTYTVNITRDLSREASANADLKGLVFNTGVATKVTATESNLVVLSGTSQILQTVITASTAATLTVNGVTAPSGSKVTIPLNATGTTVVTTVITAENGTTKTYTVNVTKQPSSNAEIKGLVFNTGVATKVSPTLSNLVVSTGTSQIAQTIFTADTAATLTVNGAPATSGGKVIIQLNATGTTTITNVITAENGTAKTYIVKVNRELSANADMKGLVFNTGVATKISDTESTVLVSLATTQITQTVITADTAATLTVNGVAATSGVKVTIRLNATGKTVITNVITAENGTTKTYTVNVTKPLSSNAEMKGLVFNTGVATKINATESNLVVTAGTSQITQTIITADAAATLTVNGVTATSGAKVTIPLNATGTTTITNVITAENGTAKTYTVTVSKELSANADLKGLIFSTGVATKVSEVESNLVVSAGTAQILQTVITADTAATLTVNGVTATSGAKVTIPLNATGTTTITNVITAENGNAKTYTVNVTKQQSANADLKGLVFSTGVATKVNATVTNLVVTGLTISQITQTLTPADAAATLTVNGATATSGAKVTIPLNATGTTTITNVITAESGATKTYTVNVTKQASTNTALRGLVYDTGVTTRVGPTESNLVVSGLTIGQVTQTTITADAAATLTVNGASATSGSGVVIPLNTTGTTTVTTIVTAESGATKTYKVNITKQPSANADLSSLILDADTLSKTTATDYSVVVGNLATTVVQKVTTADAGATLTVNGATVVSGSDVVITLNDDTPTIITTIVTSETGVTKTYTVTVSKPSMTTTSLTSGNKATTNSTARETTSSLIPHQALSPNGDGINDYFEIEGIAAYPNNAVTIINRNGSKVYEVKGYDNQSKRFDGHSNINGALLPVGTYFYLIEYTKDGQKVRKTGYMAIKN
jgi:gliding motility-associated-like protein